MFFLGGINSILPYLIYLTFIWVFIIVGFGNKINSFFQSGENKRIEINKTYKGSASAKKVNIFSHNKTQKSINIVTFLVDSKQYPVRFKFKLLNDSLFLSDKINTDNYRAPPHILCMFI